MWGGTDTCTVKKLIIDNTGDIISGSDFSSGQEVYNFLENCGAKVGDADSLDVSFNDGTCSATDAYRADSGTWYMTMTDACGGTINIYSDGRIVVEYDG